MSEVISFLGMSWVKGQPKTVTLPFGTKEDDLVCITRRQLWAVLQVFEAAAAATPETIAANPLLSWLVGFEAGSERSKKHSCSNSDPGKHSSPLLAAEERGLRSSRSETDLLILSALERLIELIGSQRSPYFKAKNGDSVAADPRNNGTPDTSEKGVNGDA